MVHGSVIIYSKFEFQINKVLSKQVQIVDSSGQAYIIQGGNQDIMDAIQGNYPIAVVFGGRTTGSSIKRVLSAELWVNFKIFLKIMIGSEIELNYNNLLDN